MGIQSQLREGAVKACKKRATKAKYKVHKRLHQTGIQGHAFVPELDCKICVAHSRQKQGIPTRIPKRPHDPRCSKNRKTKGLSVRTVEVQKICEKNIRENNIPPRLINPSDARSFGSDLRKLWCPQAKNASATAPRKPTPFSTTPPGDTSMVSDKMITDDHKNQRTTLSDLAVDVRNHIQRAMEDFDKFKSQQGNQWITECNAPTVVALAVHYLTGLFEHRRCKNGQGELPTTEAFTRSYEKFREIFPIGTCEFVFPVDPSVGSAPPSPFYHCLAGQSLYYLDWQLLFPGLKILCCECQSNGKENFVVHQRTNFGKNKSLFPLWRATGDLSWCVVMCYECPDCKEKYVANEARVLSQIPAHFRQTYPVDCRYATRDTFQLDKTLSGMLDTMMLTNGNANLMTKLIYRKQNQAYTDKLITYLSQDPVQDFVSHNGFRSSRDQWPPSPDRLRGLYEKAETSVFTPYGYSNKERYKREMQSVSIGPDEMSAIDWTFQVMKNYNLPGATAMFTWNKGSTKEVCTLQAVRDTSVSQIAHAVSEMKQKRVSVKPAILYTDTCPHNMTFWKTILGSGLILRLGLFHLIQRIFKTLDTRSLDFWECLVKLKSCIYSYHEVDLDNLYRCLKDGSFAADGKKLTDSEIRALEHSPKWKQRFGAYLRKKILPGEVVRVNLQRWIDKYSTKTDAVGLPVFTRTTDKVATQQKENVSHTADCEGVDYYREIPAGPRSTHGLSKWLSTRAESILEKFHEFLAHFGNTGTNPALADLLCLRGTCEWNVRCRWQCHSLESRTNPEHKWLARKYLPPGYLEDIAPFTDHSALAFFNKKCRDLDLTECFEFVTPIRPDNGEVFLSEYFFAQEERNKKGYVDEKTKLCRCEACQQALLPTSGCCRKQRLVEEQQTEQGGQATSSDTASGNRQASQAQPVAAGEKTVVSGFHKGWKPSIATYQPQHHAAQQRHFHSRPVDCSMTIPSSCTPLSPFYFPTLGMFPVPQQSLCRCKVQQYLARKSRGQIVLGRPPNHETFCPLAHANFST